PFRAAWNHHSTERHTMKEIDLASWLRHGRELLESAYGPHGGPVRIVVRFLETDGRLSYLVPGTGDCGDVPHTALSPLEAEIIRVVSGCAPITAKAIASRLRRPCDSGLRTILANLCERRPPMLASGKAGYRLALETQPQCACKAEPSANGYHEPHLNGRFS